MPTFSSFDGTKLHYLDEGDGQPVVMLHGIIANTELNFRAPGIWTALADAGFRCIGLDARGHGESEKPHEREAYANEAMVKDVTALFDHLSLAGADVVGYSMGAGVGMKFAQTDPPIRRLVLGGFGGRFARADNEDNSRFADAFDAPDESTVPEELLPFRRFAMGSGMDMDALRALVRSEMFSGGFDPSKVKAPTLVVCGEDDVSPDELASDLPDGRAVRVPGDHFTAVLTPELAKEIVAFLSS